MIVNLFQKLIVKEIILLGMHFKLMDFLLSKINILILLKK